MSNQDEEEFLRFLRSTGRTVILPTYSSSADFVGIDYFPEATETEATRRFWLKNLDVSMPIVTSFDPSTGHFVIDEFQSPVIEFVRSLAASTFILPGRLRAELNYYDSEKSDLIQKPMEFRKWVESLKGWFRKNYTHLEWLIYAGPGAFKFREEGGILH